MVAYQLFNLAECAWYIPDVNPAEKTWYIPDVHPAERAWYIPDVHPAAKVLQCNTVTYKKFVQQRRCCTYQGSSSTKLLLSFAVTCSTLTEDSSV